MRSSEGHGGARSSGRPRGHLHAPTQQQRHDAPPCRIFSLTVARFFKNCGKNFQQFCQPTGRGRTMKVEALEREFRYNGGLRLPDPNPS